MIRVALTAVAVAFAGAAVPASAATTIEGSFYTTFTVARHLDFDGDKASWLPSCAARTTCSYDDSYQWGLSGYLTATSQDGRYFTAVRSDDYSGLVSLEGNTYPYFRRGNYTITLEKVGDAYTLSSLSYALALSSDHFAGTATATRVLTASFVAVPEPATWAMMIAGFGMIGGAMRRRGRPALA